MTDFDTTKKKNKFSFTLRDNHLNTILKRSTSYMNADTNKLFK